MTPIRVAILTISDKGSRGERADTSGPALATLVEGAGWKVTQHAIVPDERDIIASTLRTWCDAADVDLVLTSGGTGLAERDITPEATLDVAERLVPGLAEEMRRESLQSTPHAMLSRSVAAVRKRSLIVNLPGSERGAVECLSAVMPALPHAIALLRGDTEHGTQTRT